MKKQLTKEERYTLAVKLDGILGADLLPDEEYALQEAIEIISPEFAAVMEEADREVAEWFEHATEEDLRELDEWARREFPPSPNGKIIPFWACQPDSKGKS